MWLCICKIKVKFGVIANAARVYPTVNDNFECVRVNNLAGSWSLGLVMPTW